ncbi:hypothetical protein JW968_01045 [Candidatus Woesearchaeota archaeon]|nr:hypothetical protein [Candidatus Woesearchaeota archaeon]
MREFSDGSYVFSCKVPANTLTLCVAKGEHAFQVTFPKDDANLPKAEKLAGIIAGKI